MIKDGIQMSLTDVHWCGIDHDQGRCFDITILNKNSDVAIGPNALYILGRTLDLNDTVYYRMDIPINTIIEPNMEKEYNDRHLIIPGDSEDAQIKTPGCSIEVILFYNGEIIEEWYQDIAPIGWEDNS